MSRRYVLLGSGRQAVAAGYDFARFGGASEIVMTDLDIAVAESAAARINRLAGADIATGRKLDVRDTAAVRRALDGASAAVGAVHYTHNLALTDLAIDAKVHFTDFGGNTTVVRHQLRLDEKAKRAGITIVPDCGMGPGLNVSLATYVMSRVEKPLDVRIWDGGLPQDPQPPWNYALTFSVAGLTNEYDGNAVFLRGGRLTEVPCFEDLEELVFPEPMGRLEAFVTSGGLSTAPWTFLGILRRLENKTLRYPGHAARFKAFRDLGLLDQEPVRIGPTDIRPRDVFHVLLERQLAGPDIKDVCVMRVTCSGETGGRPSEATVELIDRYDEATGFTAMQRLTGWHASIMAIAACEERVRPGAVSVENALPGPDVVSEARKRGLAIEDR